MEKAFSSIYANKRWYNGSGSGSLPKNTSAYRKFLQRYLRDHQITSVVDLGCGDWQSSRLIDWTGIEYLGIDVVPQVIEANQAKFSSPNIRFKHLDITNCEPPPADLVILKDVLQHWPNQSIINLFDKLGVYPHAIITNDIAKYDITNPSRPVAMPNRINTDVTTGDGRSLDLSLPPFNWPVQEQLRYSSVKERGTASDIKSVVTFSLTPKASQGHNS